MKHTIVTILLTLAAMAVQAQTVNVVTGSVTTKYTAEQADEMVYSDGGATLTIGGKAFSVSDISQIYIDESTVTDNSVEVSYSGDAATVTVSGNIAPYIETTLSGAHVSVVQGEGIGDDTGKVVYTLSGSSTDGEFYLEGSYKMDLELNGLTLTNPTGAPINLQNGKAVNVSVKKGTTNTLTDCASGTQKACFVIKGHADFKGQGTLNVYGKTAHAIKTSDYMTVKNLTLNILEAVKDGINANEYFLMESGTLTISGVGDDAIQASLDGTESTGVTTDHEDEDTGNIYILGGTLTATATATAAKCLKSDGTVSVSGGTLKLTAAGEIDLTDETDPSYTACIKGADFEQTGGDVTLTVTGTAGRGISADDLLTVAGGTLTVNNSGEGVQGDSDNYTAKCLKAENVDLQAGTITLKATGTGGKGILAGSGTKTTSGMTSRWTDVTGSFTMGLEDGTGPTLTITTTGSRLGASSGRMARPGGGGNWPGGGGNPWNPGGETSDNTSSAKAIKAIPAVYIYGGTTTINTATDGAEGLESKTGIDIEGGQHYIKTYDDCINSAGQIYFNGGATVCYSFGNDAVDSNAGSAGAVTIGDGAMMAYSSKGSPEEGIDCDNNSYIRITGTGIGISAGGVQSSASGTVSNAKQGYAFISQPSSYSANTYYTLADESGNNLVTYAFEAGFTNKCSFITATGMKSGSTYTIKSSKTAPTDATTAFHGLYIGSSASGTTSAASFSAK